MLVDPRGEIPEDDLLDFLEKYIEPEFWPWLRQKQKEVQELEKEVAENEP
jgi:flagellar biosynthesis chaperone FliJ